jgi:hypothetical protein
MKAGIADKEKTSITRQRQGKHVSALTVSNATARIVGSGVLYAVTKLAL